MKNIYLFQPQYAVDVRNEVNYYLPYSAGCIWSYVEQYPDIKENFRLADIIFRRESVEEVLSRLDNPFLCGFSCYVWNERWCTVVAEAVKQKWPNCLIVFGGPQVHGGMTSLDFIDVFVRGEGEENFLDLLRGIIDGKAPELFYSRRRVDNLDIPSPYTTGVFDKIIADNPQAVWAMTLETNRGCPYSCTFCDWGGLTYAKIKKFDVEKVRQELEWTIGKPIRYIVCADANVGIFKERDLEIAKIVRDVADRGKSLEGCNFQYAKNSTEIVFQIAKTIGNLGRGVTISVQSMNDDTLEAIKRKNMDVNNMRKLFELSYQYDVPTYTELILGMPHETYETWIDGFDALLDAGQHSSIDMWFTQILTNSEMNNLEYRKTYGIKSVIAKDYMPLYNANDSRDIEEVIELVNATNTMSTESMIESYLYGWLIIYFHIAGYSQIVARYLRETGGIERYSDYYRLLLQKVIDHDVFGEHYNKNKILVDHYLKTGELLPWGQNKNGGHAIHSASYLFLFENRTQAFDLAIQTAEVFAKLPDWVIDLQRAMLVDETKEYPLSITADFDIFSAKSAAVTYTIQSKFDIKSNMNWYHYRRKGLVKNLITVKEHT